MRFEILFHRVVTKNVQKLSDTLRLETKRCMVSQTAAILIESFGVKVFLCHHLRPEPVNDEERLGRFSRIIVNRVTLRESFPSFIFEFYKF